MSLDDADHLLTDPNDATYAATVIAAWARRYLSADPDAEPSSESEEYHESGATARNGGGFLTHLDSRGFDLLADEPRDAGGTEQGPTPYDYLAMSLAACTAMTIRLYAQRKGWPLDEIDVRVTHTRIHADDCADCDHTDDHIDRLDTELRLPDNLDPDHHAALVRIADRCPVHRTLDGQIEIHTRTR